MAEGLWYQMLLAAKTTRLSDEEKALIIDKGHVDWAKLLTKLFMFAAINRATTMGNAAVRSKKLTSAKLFLLDDFQKAFDSESFLGHCTKTIRWRSALCLLGIDFMRLVEEGSMRDRKPLPEAIADTLKTDWKPSDNEHANTAYYIAGAMLKTMDNLAKRKENDMALRLKHLKAAVTTTKQSTKLSNLPSMRVEVKEKVALTYAINDFYNMLLKIESVYHNLMREKSVALFGGEIAGDIAFTLESFNDALGFDKLLPITIDEETRAEIFRALISSYSNLRGRDFALKKNALADNNTTQSLRANLSVLADLAKEKRKKNKNKKEATDP